MNHHAGPDRAGPRAILKRICLFFERLNPQAHRDFLCSLGIDDGEVDEICGWARRLSAETERIR